MAITEVRPAIIAVRPRGIAGVGFAGTSSTLMTIGIGSQSFATQPNLAYRAGGYVRLVSAANPANYFEGKITAYADSVMTVYFGRIGATASGTFDDWSIVAAGEPGAGDILSTLNGADFPDKDQFKINFGLQGGWHAAGVQADNDATFPGLQMNMKADYVTLYNPLNGLTKTITTGLTKPCAINGGPYNGGRDQVGAFTGGQIIWFYYIWGPTMSVDTICSATPPTSGGPTLPAGFTYFCPAFVVPLVTTATLLPLLPQGGSTSMRVRGNRVFYTNTPLFEVSGGGGTYVSTTDMSAWIPRPGALSAQIEMDPELFSSAGVAQAGFLPMAKSGDPYGNLSVYMSVISGVAAQNDTMEMPIDDNGHIYSQWDVISGTPTSYVSVFFLLSYTFSVG